MLIYIRYVCQVRITHPEMNIMFASHSHPLLRTNWIIPFGVVLLKILPFDSFVRCAASPRQRLVVTLLRKTLQTTNNYIHRTVCYAIHVAASADTLGGRNTHAVKHISSAH